MTNAKLLKQKLEQLRDSITFDLLPLAQNMIELEARVKQLECDLANAEERIDDLTDHCNELRERRD